MSLLFMLSGFAIPFLPRSKCLLISWLQSQSAVILEPKKRQSVMACTFSPSICPEVMGPDTMIFMFQCWFSVRFCQYKGLERHCGRAKSKAFPAHFSLLPSADQLLVVSGWPSGFSLPVRVSSTWKKSSCRPVTIYWHSLGYLPVDQLHPMAPP